jgi:catechol O-methyltransferase
VFGCELDTKFGAIARDFVKLAGLEGIVRICDGRPAEETIRGLRESGELKHIDMLFFDHWEKYYRPDVQACEEMGLLGKGSVLIADNTDKPGAPDYLDYVRKGVVEKAEGLRYQTWTVDTKGGHPGAPNALEITDVL